MKRYIKAYKWNFFLWIAASLFELSGYILSSFVSKTMGDIAMGTVQISLLKFACLIIPLPFIMGAAEYFCGMAEGTFQKKCMIALKKDIFEKILKKNISAFQGEHSAKYISILNNEVRQIGNDYFFALPYLMTRILTLVAASTVMFLYSPVLAVVNIGVSLLPLLAPVIMGKSVDGSKKKELEALECYNADVKDAFNGFETVKGFHAEKKILQKNGKKADEFETKMQKFRRILGLSNYIADSFTYISIVAGTFISILFVIGGYATLGEFLAMAPLSNQVMNPAREAAQFLLILRSARPSIQRVEEILDAEVEKESGKDIEEPLPVTFSHVKFGYEKGKDIIKDFSFKFEPGKKYAIVGGSGSGKSTLLKLLMHYYDNYKGEIYLNQDEIKEIRKQSQYENVAMIHQKSVLFEDTIRNNITMFGDYSSGQAEQAAAEAGLTDLIQSAPKGMETIIKENGQNFSGGEQQRFSIARAFLRKTKLLLLDEATASLDNQTAEQIDNLVLGRQDLTAIVVTHRLQEKTLRKYDEILTLKDGMLVEHGDFEKLMEMNGFFRSLYMVNQ